MRKSLQKVRDKVLGKARLEQGQTVLDLGAGTGLLALAARSKVTAEGRVLALDVSADALRACVAQARRTRKVVAALAPVAGDLLRLPLADDSVDVALARSVLMHVHDKAAAIREIFRVVRAGGTVSVFEPINDVYLKARDVEAQEIAAALPDHPRVRMFALGRDGENPSFLGFDERDLLRWFREAGFRHVQLDYREVHVEGFGEAKRETVVRNLRFRPNPNAISHEEAARELLGEAADDYLDKLIAFELERGSKTHSASSFSRPRSRESSALPRPSNARPGPPARHRSTRDAPGPVPRIRPWQASGASVATCRSRHRDGDRD
jgi:SAM-dependent methyltransferase